MPRVLLGYEASSAYSPQRRPVYIDLDQLVNPHAIFTGDTGTGKTYNLENAIKCVVETAEHPVRVHLFDVHGDIRPPESMTSMVRFSASSPYGLNPLKINPDPDAGGVRKCIQTFIETLRLSPTHSRALGPKQQDVLRNLLTDVFELHGFDPDDHTTWDVSDEPPPTNLLPGRTYIDVPFAEKDLAKNVARSSGVNLTFGDPESRDGVRCWHVDKYDGPITRWPLKQWGKVNPTLNTLLQYATRRREMSFTGMGQKEAALMDVMHRKANAMAGRLQQHAKNRNSGGVGDEEKASKELEKAKADYLAAMQDYVATIEHGGALDALIKYDSFDSLSTVKQILDSLNSCGIFRDTPPNFDPAKPVWRYYIKDLRAPEQKFLVNVRLTEIFYAAVQKGECDYIREICVIDEAVKFIEDDDEHILNVLVLEARKFGLGIFLGGQSPTQFSDSLLTSVATKVCMGLDPGFWPLAQRRLRIDERLLKWIRPREGLIVNFKLKGQSTQPWVQVTTTKAALNGGQAQ